MKIDLIKKFPHLSHAPIVEALIDIRAKPSVEWNQEAFITQFKDALPNYPKVEAGRQLQSEIKAITGKLPEQRFVDLGWSGLRFRSQDELQVAQFLKEGFAFSRLQPYQNWESFISEAMRLWGLFVDVMRPEAIQRIGVRFINRMPFPADGFILKNYIVGSSQPLAKLGLVRTGFLHHDLLAVPETFYMVNLVSTVQLPEGMPPKVPVILDIDVFTATPMELDGALLRQRLGEMRVLKNKIFFGSITPRTKGIIQ